MASQMCRCWLLVEAAVVALAKMPRLAMVRAEAVGVVFGTKLHMLSLLALQ